MKWFKHMTATWEDEKIARLVADGGMAGYGYWWRVLEIVAAGIEKDSPPTITYPISRWSQLLVTRGSHVMSTLLRLPVTVERHGSDVTVTITNLLKYRDEYTRKSGHCREQEAEAEAEAEADIKQRPPEGAADGEVLPDESPIQHPRPNPKAEDVWFESEFWPIWPLKKGKEEARKAARAIKTPELRAAIISALKAQIPEMKGKLSRGEPIKWAQGWLTNKRWEDEPQLPGLVVAPRYGPGPTRSELALQRLREDIEEEQAHA